MTTPSKPQDAPAMPGAPLPDDWQDQDFSGCFWLAVRDAKERVARGEPLPRWLRSTREAAE